MIVNIYLEVTFKEASGCRVKTLLSRDSSGGTGLRHYRVSYVEGMVQGNTTFFTWRDWIQEVPYYLPGWTGLKSYHTTYMEKN
jgi:hypothetical protein